MCAAQHNLVPQPIGPLYVDNSTFNSLASTNNIFYNGDIIIPAPNTAVSFPQTGPVNVVSNHRIVINSGTTIHPNSNNRVHCSIASTDLGMAVFSPLQAANTQPVAYQNEKFEIGLNLPQNIFNAVEAFCDHDPDFPNPVNPFNPEELNVYAVFTKINANQTGTDYPEVYGFYYREFKRNMSADQRKDWTWDLDTTSFTFRIRFAPPVTGLWLVKVFVECPAYNYSQSNSFYFNCLASPDPDNKGFVHTLPNKSYFELDGEMFYPIGENIPHPEPFSVTDYAYGHGPYGWKTINLAGYLDYENRLKFLANYGGNFFRMMTAPWTTEIEFEHLNDYSERLNGPWEMDRILDLCAEKNLYMDLDLHYFTALDKTTAYGHFFWDWKNNQLPCPPDFGAPTDNGYCYHYELGLTNPEEMLTDAQAKKFYKYRLRYMMARYGYSRNIAMIELGNEVDAICQDRDIIINSQGYCAPGNVTDQPYANDPGFRQNVALWQTEMIGYLKNDLNMTDHILSVSYTSPPNSGSGDNSYLTADIDINNFNYYDNFLRINSKRSQDQIDYGQLGYGRPLFCSETGSTLILCSDYTEWVRTVWSMPFVGCAGGLNWPGPVPNVSGYYHFSTLATFLQDVDFNQGDWLPVYEEQSDHMAEALYLKQLGGSQNNFVAATGVVLNRTYNTYNFADNNNSECHTFYLNNSSIDPYENPSNPIYAIADVEPPADDDDKIVLTDMGVHRHFVIDWFDPFSGVYFLSEEKYSTIGGKLYLDYPTLYCSSSLRPIIAYHIRVYSPDRQAHIATEAVPGENLGDTLTSTIQMFNLYPNPAVNSITIQPFNFSKVYSLQVFSSADQQALKTARNLSGEIKIDISGLPPGFYWLKLDCEDKTYFFKFIKTE
jgi:hypothetical protein